MLESFATAWLAVLVHASCVKVDNWQDGYVTGVKEI